MPTLVPSDALAMCRDIIAMMQDGRAPLSAAIERTHHLAVLIGDAKGECWLRLEQHDHRFIGPVQSELGERLKAEFGSVDAARSYVEEMSEAWLRERTVRKLALRLDGVVISEGDARRGESVAGLESMIEAFRQVGAGLLLADLSIAEVQGVLDRIRIRVHEYLISTEARLRARLAATTAIEGAARQIESAITAKAPEVLDHLRAADEALRGGGVDGPAHALLSLRRALLVLADRVYPAAGHVTCADGVSRDLSHDKYKNRIVEFVSVASRSKSGRATAVAEIEHVAPRLDALYVQQNKGVHDEVLAADAERVIARTYFIVGDVLDLIDG